MEILHFVVRIFFGFLIVAFFASWILSFFQLGAGNPILRFVNIVIGPIREPLDRRIPTIGVLNVSFLVALWALFFVMNLILIALPPTW